MKRSKLRKALGRAGIYVVWIIATLAVLFPIYWLFVVSARTRVELFGGPNLIQTHFYAPNYTKPLSSPIFQRYLLNSVLISTLNALLVVILAVGATYALSRWRLKGEGSIFFWTISGGVPAARVPALYPSRQDRQLVPL
jgi:glycerol transport system permease protein